MQGKGDLTGVGGRTQEWVAGTQEGYSWHHWHVVTGGWVSFLRIGPQERDSRFGRLNLRPSKWIKKGIDGAEEKLEEAYDTQEEEEEGRKKGRWRK